MEFIFKQTDLLDGDTVHDVQLITNGKSEIHHKQVCIFSCQTESQAAAFLTGLESLVEKHTVETLEEV